MSTASSSSTRCANVTSGAYAHVSASSPAPVIERRNWRMRSSASRSSRISSTTARYSRSSSRVWTGGVVTGTITLGAGETVRLIADPPLAGLDANARPDPATIPNNHLSYAIQWFLFALTALVIYAIALRKRMQR